MIIVYSESKVKFEETPFQDQTANWSQARLCLTKKSTQQQRVLEMPK